MSDKDRAHALAEYEILDSLPEKEFDDIVELASAICGTPISAISLLDLDRQWFKAQVGLGIDQTPIDQSFCRYAAEDPEQVMVINDTLGDDRFKNNPLTLGNPHIRFYAGAPLVTDDGVSLGALCVIDRQPREFTDMERRMLQILAKRIMKLFEMRKENLHQKKVIQSTNEKFDLILHRLLEAQELSHIGNFERDMSTGKAYWSPELYKILDPYRKKEIIQDSKEFMEELTQIMHPEDRQKFKDAITETMITLKPLHIECRLNNALQEKWSYLILSLKVDDHGVIQSIHGTVQDITFRKNAEKNHLHYIEMLEAMLYDVSHVIRRPLTTLMGLLPILTAEATSKEDFRNASEYFYASLKELEDYTRDLNDRLQSSKLRLLDSKGK